MLTIKKVLNSSVILVEDADGRESILLGKGIGYGQKAGAPVPSRASDQVFISTGSPDTKSLVELLTSIPGDYIEITRDIVQHAESQGMTLHPHIYLALTDHLHFAVARFHEQLTVVNRLAWEIQTFYPKEYGIGLFGLTLLRDRLQVDLPDEEAANIAFHIANAHSGSATFDTLQAVKIIDAVVTIVRYSMSVQLLDDNLHFSRFISHIQYFVGRLLDDRMLSSDDDFLFTQIGRRYPEALASAEKIRHHIDAQYEKQISNEEVAYLALHIQRLTTP